MTGLSGEIECVIFTPGSLQQSSCTGLAYPNLRPLCRCFKDDKHRHKASDADHWSTGVLELPELFATFTMEKAAQEVRNDFPTHWPTELAKQFLKPSEETTMDPTIVPQMSKGVFVNRQVLLSRVIGWAVSTVSPTAFACKWKYGRARPEELAWAVHKQSCTLPDSDDVDINNIRTDIENMGLVSATDFTAYDEGSPNHPSYPAMHSAASSASLFFPVLMKLSQTQINEARKLDYAVATSRSFAGVHYPSDNLAGLAIGQQVVADALPGMLQGMGFGERNVAAAIAKIETHKHNWFVWEARGCAINSDQPKCNCPCCEGDDDRAGCPVPVTYAYNLGTQSCPAEVNSVTSQADCIGASTNSYQATTSKVLDFLKPRNDANRIDNFPIRNCGEVVGANAKGCWTNGDSLFYVTGEPGTKGCDAVELDTRVGPVCAL